MKKTSILLAMLAMSASSWAQNAVLKGKFRYEMPNHQNASSIFFTKAENGDLSVIAEPATDKADGAFRTAVTPADQNTIRFIGAFDEHYPVYLRKGEELTVEAADGLVTYAGKLSKENKVFSDWYKMTAPIRKYGYTKNARLLPTDRLAKLLDSLAGPVENFVKNINTGNAVFDKEAKHMLPYSYKFDLVMPFAMGVGFENKSKYPVKYVNWFKNENFSDKGLWDLPFAFRYMQYFAFAKHIIYNQEQGISGEMLPPEISDKSLRANYILAYAEKGASQDRVAFLKKYEGDMLNDEQRTKMKMFKVRAGVQVAGGDWIDFSYPDRNGKMHKLSDNLGKVVLIDVWATWCKPCLAEQPALEALEKSFEGKDVVFISLSIDTDKAKWKQMIEEEKLSGLHLYSNNQGAFLKDYEVESVPRFILFDKNGKTVSFNAARPSDPKLKELITSKL
ncbi:thiol-disulfide isomerase/thioredoxin [Pedobacter africanus]|uniref:Thiol-disulfide isomerase/thioredoxin n=1 Tax=Pedobacter africanus TaxID=151894 RepID=A0ACC6KZF6_9SPHI|nr:TlpA disulfide reductase family protein [Pedobacter africanus]MDR6784508.1 thiol-disulfide isomerase/thioredoxin [Pedobacter africanus]